MSGNLLWNRAEQREEIIVQSLTHFDKPTGLHGFPIQYAIDMLLGHTDSTPQLGFGKAEFDTPFLDFGEAVAQGIDQSVRLNRALWLLADGLRKLKA